nr:MAG TPA: hypothetical protein [Caudoviricetes sp.]
MKFTPHNLTVHSPVGCDPFIKDNTLRITSVRTDKRSKTFFTSAEVRLRLYRAREEDPEVMLLHREKKKGFVYASYIVYFQSRDAYSLLVKINDMELVRDSIGDPLPLFDMEANFYELVIKLSVLGDLREPTSLTFTVPDQWSITREESWEFTRAINQDLTGRAYGTTIQYETTTMEVYKWIYVLFKMYSDTL